MLQMKPWHLFVATGLLVLALVWGLAAEQGQEHPGPLVPYTLVAVPILFISGIALAVRDRMNRKP
ncbi:MAG TPA: hypothetical protein VFY54_05395 [Rubrobacter sp.]|nr:hypothetical protein [Rubrobacter sp.]